LGGTASNPRKKLKEGKRKKRGLRRERDRPAIEKKGRFYL